MHTIAVCDVVRIIGRVIGSISVGRLRVPVPSVQDRYDLVIAGMAPFEVLRRRLLTAPLMVLTGRCRTGRRNRFIERVVPGKDWTRASTNIAAFLPFQAPVLSHAVHRGGEPA
ncbi:L-alanine exporter AlaE [Jannaschia rubra]|uniref:L-alanine exporter AlaE n=1 Tax=Jannaschia rubra TaxID=282197 RepID=UPI0009E753EB